MIEQTNLPLDNKNTKKIEYELNLDDEWWYKEEYDGVGKRIYYEESDGFWCKTEYDSEGNIIYFEDIRGDWYKTEYNSEGKVIYFEDSDGIIQDDR